MLLQLEYRWVSTAAVISCVTITIIVIDNQKQSKLINYNRWLGTNEYSRLMFSFSICLHTILNNSSLTAETKRVSHNPWNRKLVCGGLPRNPIIEKNLCNEQNSLNLKSTVIMKLQKSSSFNNHSNYFVLETQELLSWGNLIWSLALSPAARRRIYWTKRSYKLRWPPLNAKPRAIYHHLSEHLNTLLDRLIAYLV